MPVYVGSRDPEALDLRITSTGFDLTTVTGVELTVRSPAGAALSWPWTIAAGAQATVLHLTHLFAVDGSDVPVVGNYIIAGWLIVAPGGVETTRRRIKPITVPAVAYT